MVTVGSETHYSINQYLAMSIYHPAQILRSSVSHLLVHCSLQDLELENRRFYATAQKFWNKPIIALQAEIELTTSVYKSNLAITFPNTVYKFSFSYAVS